MTPRTLRKFARAAWTRFTAQYVVCVQDGITGAYSEYFAHDWKDAVEWVGCQGNSDTVIVYDYWLGLTGKVPAAVRYPTL